MMIRRIPLNGVMMAAAAVLASVAASGPFFG
jgi:hypothetical protein